MGQAVQSNSPFMAGSKLSNPEIHKYDWSAHVLSVDRNLLNPGPPSYGSLPVSVITLYVVFLLLYFSSYKHHFNHYTFSSFAI